MISSGARNLIAGVPFIMGVREMQISADMLHYWAKFGDSEKQDMAAELLLLRRVWGVTFNGGQSTLEFISAIDAYKEWLNKQEQT